MESATSSAAETAPPLAAETVDLAGELIAPALLESALSACRFGETGSRRQKLGLLAHLLFILLGRL
jgi:hypothetical protein